MKIKWNNVHDTALKRIRPNILEFDNLKIVLVLTMQEGVLYISPKKEFRSNLSYH